MSSMPQLPRQKELMSALEPYHAKLAAEKTSAKRHPVHQCNGAQVCVCLDWFEIGKELFPTLKVSGGQL
jgi:hypothetical protein